MLEEKIKDILLIALLLSLPFASMSYDKLNNENILLQEETWQQHGEIQELKQTLHMIEMMNEGKMYIDEMD